MENRRYNSENLLLSNERLFQNEPDYKNLNLLFSTSLRCLEIIQTSLNTWNTFMSELEGDRVRNYFCKLTLQV